MYIYNYYYYFIIDNAILNNRYGIIIIFEVNFEIYEY